MMLSICTAITRVITMAENKLCIYYENHVCTNRFPCANKVRFNGVPCCKTKGKLDWDKLKETEKRGR